MASPGLLFLLLMVSHLTVFAMSQPDTEQRQEGVQEAFMAFADHLDEIREALIPFLELIKDSGPAIKAVVNLILLIVTGKTKDDKVLNTLVDEFQNLNSKLDRYHAEQRWDSWASGSYDKPEMDIEVAWVSLTTLVKSLNEPADEEMKQRHIDEFLSSYQKYEPATKVLQKFLTAEGTSFINNLGQMVAERIKCGEKNIREYTAFLDTLILKGTIMNQVYYSLKKINSQARIDEAANIQYDFQSAVFRIHKYCISQIMDFVIKDVEDHIDPNKKHQDLAEEIRTFLETKYEKYEWMVVAFKTTHSDHNIVKIRNKHTLTGFTFRQSEKVRVAVTRQLKGKHTKAAEVKRVMTSCFEKVPWCYEVEKILRECKKTVGNKPLSHTYTAVHAFHGNAHESHTEDSSDTASPHNNAEFDISSQNNNEYIHAGECFLFVVISKTAFKGKYHVMIKSDEEIENDPCSKLQCGGENQGQCVLVSSPQAGSPTVGLCECKFPYYGKNCEKNLDDYKEKLKKSELSITTS